MSPTSNPPEATVEHPSRDIDFVSGEFWGADPQDELTWLRNHSPIHWDGRVWGISRYEDVKAISRDPETFCSAQGSRPDADPTPMMLDMDDPEHFRRRKLVNKGYTPRRVRAREDEIRRICHQIVDRVEQRGSCDLVWDIAAQLPLIVIANDLGVAEADRSMLLEWSDALMSAMTGDPAALIPAAEAFAGYSAYADHLITERLENPVDDLMSVLCHAEVDGDRLDRASIIGESLLILVGGDETTRHVISGGAYQLLVERSRWEQLRRDPTGIAMAVEEMLRWVSPIKTMARTATRDVEVHGAHIAAGDKVVLLYPSANRDESVFERPFEFDLARDPNEHLAFGFGSHYCLGNSLARLELRVMFETLLERLGDLALDSDVEPARRPANFVSGYETLPVHFTPAR